MTTITLHDLTKRYRDVTAVDHLSLEVRAGAVTGFLGPNGAGKSTTMRMLLGLVRPTGGTATFDGVLAAATGVPDRRVDEVLEVVGLTDAARRRVGGYSMGMRQRLALAAALLGDPETLVLDEPANGLDPEGMRWLRGFLRRLAGEGRTVLVSSHVLAELAQSVDDVVIIARGRLVTAGGMSDLLASHHQTDLEELFLDLTS